MTSAFKNRFAAAFSGLLFLLVMSMMSLLGSTLSVSAQTVCPDASVHGTTSAVWQYAYHNAQRTVPRCNRTVGIPSNGVRVFSSRAQCRSGAFAVVGENGGGLLADTLTCTNCTANNGRELYLAPNSSAQIEANFTFPGGDRVRYRATLSRGPADGSGNTLCSITGASLAGGGFGGDITDPTVSIGAIARAADGSYSALITLSEPAGNGTAFDLADLTLTNASATLTGAGTAFTARLTPNSDGPFGLAVPAAAFQDASGNPNPAAPAVTAIHDGTAPSVSIGDITADVNDTYVVAITLSEPAGNGTAFDLADLTLTNASATLTGAGTAFTARLTPNSDGTFGLAVPAGAFQDALGNANTAAPAVTAIHDRNAPTVSIEGLPSTFTGTTRFSVQITFSKPVTGFEQADISVSNGVVTAVSGSGARYAATLTATGQGDLSVQIPAGVAQDSAGNANTSSDLYTVKNQTVEETQKLIATFMAGRANNLASNQSDLSCFVLNGCQGGSFNAQVTQGLLNFSLATPRENSVWFAMKGSRVNSGASKDEYYLATLGMHGHLSETVLLGAMLEVDFQASESGISSVNGSGWLAGPYFVAKLPNQPLVFEARALWGKSKNRISPFGTYTDTFETDRRLIMLRLSGELAYGDLSLRPFGSMTYTSDAQNAYQDSLGNRIPEQMVSLGQVTLGIDFTKPIDLGGQSWLLDGGISMIRSETRLNGVITGQAAFDGTRGRAHLGLSRDFGSGQLSISGFYDGIGSDNFDALGLEVAFLAKF